MVYILNREEKGLTKDMLLCVYKSGSVITCGLTSRPGSAVGG